MQKHLTELRWGIIFTLVMLLWLWLEQLVGLHGPYIEHHATYTNLFAIPAILMYILALRQKKWRDYNGAMSWKQGIIAGLLMTLVVVLLSPLAQWLFHTMISPDYFSNVQSYAVAAQMMTPEEAAAYFRLPSYIGQSMFGAAVMGSVTSVIVAFFVRSKTT
ncbi:DUF4199 domain-containing protein [Arsukibacterium sp.]|uniref:DUF4199 domain-containing protein n=1 Tax=Arsukibacterium sp. TaxID=1977258 RepID=UPI00299F05C2|nr:DUF4199 domain-containing protein [Arsukibacterium sp.]MDX1676732.1 DUF4199 domain-containing protein [Arsukibacterium sp.]